ncbi:hypothetical protein DB44_ER00070 [Candidatus Protochlamydia amoebophila]|uniref:Uncharacterized protein n=1 Tax=Candidatus Protochlamydia amoebophila TaxID=362787 RepID=A0A0C1H865_9BACT|nr:hypothetical protein DB44_ER00070 [Candidatus Protochlamydia amoebophila]
MEGAFLSKIPVHNRTHLSQIYTLGPEMSFSTASSVLPQKEQLASSFVKDFLLMGDYFI